MSITPFIYVTAAYSNAVLTAILPHVSDFAKKLDLPIVRRNVPAIVEKQLVRMNLTGSDLHQAQSRIDIKPEFENDYQTPMRAQVAANSNSSALAPPDLTKPPAESREHDEEPSPFRPTPFIYVSSDYSNAVLTAILPHVSDFAQKLDLPVTRPITANQVARFNTSRMKGFIGGGLTLTNGYSFGYQMGYVGGFSAPDNWFHDEQAHAHWPPNWERYYGKDNMTTNEAIELARDAFRRLGYKLKDFRVNGPPSRIENSFDTRDGGHIPFCRVHWESPESIIQAMLRHTYNISFEVDLQRKRLVGMNLFSRDFHRPQPKIDIKPELDSDYRKRMRALGQTNFISPWTGKPEYVPLTNPPPLHPPPTSGMTNPPVVQPPHEVKKPGQPSTTLVHMTPAYSNAMLRAALPLVSDFARKVGLPLAQPLTASQVISSQPSDIQELFLNVLILTNHYWFMVAQGYVPGFGSQDNWFHEKGTRTDWPRYSSKDCMATNEAIELARGAFRKLGHRPEDYHVDGPPTDFENAVEEEYGKPEAQYAYCRISWDGPDREHDEGFQFDIDMRQKRVVGMLLSSTNFWRPPPIIDVGPELESDHQKTTTKEIRNGEALGEMNQHQAHLPPNAAPNAKRKESNIPTVKMFFRTNAPRVFPGGNPEMAPRNLGIAPQAATNTQAPGPPADSSAAEMKD